MLTTKGLAMLSGPTLAQWLSYVNAPNKSLIAPMDLSAISWLELGPRIIAELSVP